MFVRLYEKGLIYRGEYIINWCPRCLTALSNEEAEGEEVEGPPLPPPVPPRLSWPSGAAAGSGQGSRLRSGCRWRAGQGDEETAAMTLGRNPGAAADGRWYLTVSTTRPETMLGDTAVAVNPADERYRDLIGGEVDLPLTGRRIPIIADDYVDRDFGTGHGEGHPGPRSQRLRDGSAERSRARWTS